MTTDVGIRFGVQGERETRTALGAVNAQIRNLNSEMHSVVQSFAGMEDSEESVAAQSDVLQRSVAAQQQKISLLNGQYQRAQNRLYDLAAELDRANTEFGENSVEAARAQNAYNRQAQAVNALSSDINRAAADLTRMQRELRDVGSAADDAGDDLEAAGHDASSFGDSLKGAFLGGAVSGAVQSLIGSLAGLADETIEYRKIMGTLNVSSQKAGYTTNETTQSFDQLYAVLGDEQTAATALANLQALKLSQEQLTRLTDGAIGAWATYGDSIPIDGLAESINETVKAGAVTGTFADVLNWAGTSEDDFNDKLAEAGSESERVNLVMQELADQGLMQAADAWRQNNADIEQANLANAKLQASTAQLGSMVTPLVAGVKEGVAELLMTVIGLVEQGSPLLGVVAGLGAGIGALGLVMVIGHVASLLTGVGGLTSAVKGLFAVLAANPIGAVVTVVAALTAGLITAYKTNDEFKAKVDAAWSSIKETGQQVFNAVTDRIDGAKQSVEDAVSYITGIPQQVSSIGQNIVSGLWSGISDSKDWLLGKVEEWCGSILGGIKGFFGIHSPSTVMRDTVGMMLGRGVAEGISDSLPEAEAAAKDMAQAVTDASSATIAAPSVTLFGPEIFVKTVEGLQEQEPVLFGYLQGLMGMTLDTIISFAPEFRQDGRFLMSGVAQGIRDGRSEVVNEVRRALEAAAVAARAAMQINSPSKVFSEIGDYMAQGVGQGFTKRMTDVSKDVAAAMPYPDSRQPAFAGAADNSRSYSYGDIILNIERVDNGNGRDIQTLARELEFYRRQQHNGRGGR